MNYRVDLPHDGLSSYADEELCRYCIEPTIAAVRGRPMQVRLQVFAQLTPGQQALLGFWVIYTHGAYGWSSLHSQLPGLVGEAEFWPKLRDAAAHLGLRDLLRSIEAFQRVLESGHAYAGELAELDAQLLRILPPALRNAADYIRANPDQFVRST